MATKYTKSQVKRLPYGSSRNIYNWLQSNPAATIDDMVCTFRISRKSAFNYRWKFAKHGETALPKRNLVEDAAAAMSEGSTETMALNSDPVNHPDHYTDGGIETIDYIRAKLTPEEFRGYCRGNALKYASRAGKKGIATGSEDFAKAAWYLNYYLGNM
jgi:hypothetical protein